MVRVSVVIPTYNVENYIRETLECFLKQTLRDIEIIVVDDGSTDRTREILREMREKDNRISVYEQENQGAGIARNYGLEHATGKYVYFFDGDDYCESDFLNKVVDKAEKTGADIVVFDYYRVDQKTKRKKYYTGLNRALLPKGNPYFSYKEVPDRILTIVNPTPWNKLYNREYIVGTGLKYLGLSTTNDITFASLSVAMASKVVYFPKAFVYYRINRQDSITSQKQKRLNDVIAAVDSAVQQANQLEYAEKIQCAIVYFVIRNLHFSLTHYAGHFLSGYHRRYYKKIHRIFREDAYMSMTKELLGDNKLYTKFAEIRDNSYEKMLYKKFVESIKYFLKRFIAVPINRFDGVSKQMDEKLKKQSQSIAKLEAEVYALKQILQSSEGLGINDIPRDKKIIVSITTYGQRIYTVKQAIESIMRQTVKADRIVLWLAKDNYPNGEDMLPEGLLQLKKRGLEICWCDTDYKSYKKYMPAFEENPDDIIITIDDDLIYPVDMIEKLYDSYKKHPECISAMRVHHMESDENDQILPYEMWEKECSDYVDEPRMDLFATTGAGTLFPPHVLHQDAFNWELIQKLCPTADDVWIKEMSVLVGTETVLVQEHKGLIYIPGTQDGEHLWAINVNGNDKQLKQVTDYYEGT